MSILSNYSDEEFIKIVQESTSINDCLYNLGYNSVSGSVSQLIRKRIEELNIDISHFGGKKPIKRNEENIFIENSTAVQAVLRNWYKKGEYTPYICSICGLEPFWQGKELTLILDHINGKNKDDRLENLRWVCPNCNQQLETTGSKNIQHKEHKLNFCKKCNKLITKNSAFCIQCAAEERTVKELNFLSREELKNLIRTVPFTEIGKKYLVSDNAVRKWCDKYNLPRKVSEIKKITDEEWEKI